MRGNGSERQDACGNEGGVGSVGTVGAEGGRGRRDVREQTGAVCRAYVIYTIRAFIGGGEDDGRRSGRGFRGLRCRFGVSGGLWEAIAGV